MQHMSPHSSVLAYHTFRHTQLHTHTRGKTKFETQTNVHMQLDTPK
jgi:hypothetical protein